MAKESVEQLRLRACLESYVDPYLGQSLEAAKALSDVVPVNPFSPDDFAGALHDALVMPADEQRKRMRGLRAEVLSHTVFDWAGHLLSEACRLADGVRV